MQLKIIEREEFEMIIKPLLVISVAAFHLAVVPGSAGAYQLVGDSTPRAMKVKRVDMVGFCRIGKLAAIIRLDRLRDVAKIGVLEESLPIYSHIANNRDILDVHLLFPPEMNRRIIMP